MFGTELMCSASLDILSIEKLFACNSHPKLLVKHSAKLKRVTFLHMHRSVTILLGGKISPKNFIVAPVKKFKEIHGSNAPRFSVQPVHPISCVSRFSSTKVTLNSNDTHKIRFVHQSFMIPHPEKESKGGEDGIYNAFCISSSSIFREQ
jgi:hypothetical protein